MKQILVLVFLFTGNVFCQWHRVSTDSITSGIRTFLFNQDKVFAAGANLYVSADNGTKWFRSGTFTESIWALAAMGPYVIARTFAADNLYRSTDYGTHWSLGPVLPNLERPLESMYSAYGKFYIGTNGSGSYVSSDSGSTWKKVSSDGLIGEGILLSCYQAFGDKLFLAANYIYCSTDSGSSWQLLQRSPWAPHDLAAKDGLLFAAGSFGVSVSSDSGKTWRTINEGFIENHWWCNAIVATNKYLVAAIQSEGIWIRPFSELTGIDKTHDITNRRFSLSQNYPNPFNPETTISFNIPKRSNVTIRIYDIRGNLVQTLVNNENKSKGQYFVTWNASNISSGVYFYQITTDGFQQVRKMLLIK